MTADLIPLVGVLIPIVAVVGFFAWMISLSPVGKAMADRIRARTAAGGDGTRPGLGGPDRDQIVAALDDLRREVAQLAERVDFTERMLTQKREAERLPPVQ